MSKLMVKNKILITRFIFIAIFIFCSHMAFADDTGIVEFLNKIDSKMHLPVREGLEKIKFDINLVYYIGNSSKSGESIGKR
ncbi:hypothetical protein KA005_26750, partial [bacterium]|nr:hypothetical protein [bacterium]